MKVVVFGAGMMAKAACYDFVLNKEVSCVRIITRDKKDATKLKRWLISSMKGSAKKKAQLKLQAHACDVTDAACVAGSLKGFDIALSCVPYVFNLTLTKASIKAGVHFVDLGGNNTVVKNQIKLHNQAKKKGLLIVPDCGLAPGLVSVFTKALVDEFNTTDSIHLRVGGLPLKPTGPLNYSLVFSVKGLINEYIEPVTVIQHKKKKTIGPLSELEELTFPKPFGKMEAFTTSGGTSTLPDTYKGKIKTLDYKTIRYPGHCSQIQALHYLGLTSSERLKVGLCTVSPRDLLEQKMLQKLPKGKEDVILLRCWGTGTVKKKGKGSSKKTISYQIIDKYDKRTGLTAMMRMTAFPAAILVSLIGSGKIKEKGVLTQEHFVSHKEIFKEMKKRGIVIKKTLK